MFRKTIRKTIRQKIYDGVGGVAMVAILIVLWGAVLWAGLFRPCDAYLPWESVPRRCIELAK